MDTGLLNLFVTEFRTLLLMVLQQKTSMLRGKIDESAITGAKMASPLNLMGALQMQSVNDRFAPKTNQPQTYTRRWLTPKDKDGDAFIDSFDLLKTPIDPKNVIVQSFASACARAFDDEIISAATGAATIGTDAGSLTTESFDTSDFQVLANYGASAAVGLTVAKLNEARRMLEHYHNAEELNAGGGTLVIGSSQHADLRNQAMVVSTEFTRNGGILDDGRVKRYMGFDIVVSERLPIVSSNTRGCLAFVRSGLHLGVWQDVKTEVFRRPDLRGNPWDVSTVLSYGATRTEQGKVVQILAHDTIGADITP